MGGVGVRTVARLRPGTWEDGGGVIEEESAGGGDEYLARSTRTGISGRPGERDGSDKEADCSCGVLGSEFSVVGIRVD